MQSCTIICTVFASICTLYISLPYGTCSWSSNIHFVSFVYCYFVMWWLYFIVFAVFKKYNNVLLDNFPENYMMTLEIVYRYYPVTIPSKMVEYITTPKSYKAVNQRILDLLITLIIRSKQQVKIIDLVSIIKQIIKDFDTNVVLKRFENGVCIDISILKLLYYG